MVYIICILPYEYYMGYVYGYLYLFLFEGGWVVFF